LRPVNLPDQIGLGKTGSSGPPENSPPAAGAGGRPFAALPHDIAGDPRLSPTDVRVLLALTFWARGKASCWPSDRSIGTRIGRSPGTVQRSLRRLEGLGLIERRKTSDNATGRLLVLRWRSAPATAVSDPPAAPAREESGEKQSKIQPPGGGMGLAGPPPPAEENPEASALPSIEDLEQLRRWAAGPDPTLARIARAGLALAGVAQELVAGEKVEPAPAPVATTVNPTAGRPGPVPRARPNPRESPRRLGRSEPGPAVEGVGESPAVPALWASRRS
jgi:hypothetical protein